MIGELKTGEDQLNAYLRMVDLLIEVRDARAPASCEDRMFERLSRRRERIFVLSQADLADPTVTADWCRFLADRGSAVFVMDLKRGKGLGLLRKHFKSFTKKLSKRNRNRSFSGGHRPVRAMVVGVPNTGKSSLINRLAGQRRARVGACPGITRGPQWIKISRNLELLDTPGVLNPRTDRRTLEILAITGSVPVESVDIEELVSTLLERLPGGPSKVLCDMAGVKISLPPAELIDRFAFKRAFLLPGGKPDRHRAAMAIFSSFRKGDLGQVTLEIPEKDA